MNKTSPFGQKRLRTGLQPMVGRQRPISRARARPNAALAAKMWDPGVLADQDMKGAKA